MLKKRIITALILIPIVVALLFYLPPPAFLFLTAAIILLASIEWMSLMKLEHVWSRLLYLFILIGCMCGIVLYLPIPFIIYVAMMWWLAALVLVVIYPGGTACWRSNKIIKGIMGAMVLLPCWVALNFIRNGADGTYALLFVFILIWGADSTAYFAGKKWGTTKLAPLVSPGKSIQGVAGAVAFAILFTIISAQLTHTPWNILFYAVTLSVFTVLFSVLGDLFESMIKRLADVKDSGNLLPGHGGLLDRIDSLTAAAPVYAFGILLMQMLFS